MVKSRSSSPYGEVLWAVSCVDLGGQLSLAPVLSRAQIDGRLQSNFVTMNPINPKPKTQNPKS